MRRAAVPILFAGLAACADPETPRVEVFRPEYGTVAAEALADDLLRVEVAMTGARDGQDVVDYADCALAGSALDRGFGFARQVRTNVVEEGGVWRADAVYTVSPAVPRGLRTIDAEAAVETCRARGIPTV